MIQVSSVNTWSLQHKLACTPQLKLEHFLKISSTIIYSDTNLSSYGILDLSTFNKANVAFLPESGPTFWRSSKTYSAMHNESMY